MARKPAPKKRTGSPRLPLTLLGTLAVAAGAYFTVVWLGDQAGQAVQHRDRYRAKFDDIDCDAPPGMDRATFLAEVRYLGQAPAEFSTADAKAIQGLAAAFAKHPWVAEAFAKETLPAWPHPVRLVFRTPALAVAIAGAESSRVIDNLGVLLPAAASEKSLPRLLTPQPAPRVDAGQRWPNADVQRALDLAKDHDAATIEKTATGWRITQKNGRVLNAAR